MSDITILQNQLANKQTNIEVLEKRLDAANQKVRDEQKANMELVNSFVRIAKASQPVLPFAECAAPIPHKVTLERDEPTRRVERTVIEKITNRGDIGLEKYGQTMDRKDLTFAQWATHAQEEMLDGAQYLERAIEGSLLLEDARTIVFAAVRDCPNIKLPLGYCEAWLTAYGEQFGDVS